ncbi:ATP-binding protein [Micromonospora craniellae]|uniref:ATP-binding protein n=1 Tax=Micromonospora craniellae TaxID=2294034 RepID=UPI00131413A8|nr:ATP-grasp domain-containing protein [Micromonospora craniellae]QOC91463.1 ATP-grasp domain-containing protein [Micromonospora craniellae]
MTATAPADGTLWSRCGGCATLLYRKRLRRNLDVCPECGRHARLAAPERVRQLVDPASFQPLPDRAVEVDPIGFVDVLPYPHRLTAARADTGLAEAVLCGAATVGRYRCALAVMDLAALADKSSARALMRRAGLPLPPGAVQTVPTVGEAAVVAAEVGYPVIVKAAAGGGGRGMTVVRTPADLPRAYARTRAAAQAAFGDDRVYVERYLSDARHVEVQVLCDSHGNGVHLGTRDCSVQRRHQKLVEEAPAPALAPAILDALARTALRGALDVGFTGAGTVEFLVDAEDRYHFLEINCRIQVEHPVTEMVTGIDLVHEQFHVAAGTPLRWRQEDVRFTGVAVECRVNVEDPDRGFAPTPGRLDRFVPPGGPFTRVDTHGHAGYLVGPHYDSLLAKVAVWAPDRDLALNRLDRALREFEITGPGVRTTIPFVRRVLDDADFRKGRYSTGLVDRLTAGPPPVHPRRNR